MTIIDATSDYERWAARRVPLIDADLKAKHRAMRADAFSFLRATYYRWAQIWRELAADLAKMPAVLSVGDLHVENFGTWRDAEGRLVWGINDFDEADELPFTNDLIRLSVSAVIAIEQKALPLHDGDAVALILDGYREGIRSGGMPFVLEERHRSLREIASSRLKAAGTFWGKLVDHPASDRPPRPARRLLERLMPPQAKPVKLIHRSAGLGSLGRRRYTAIGELSGGLVAREVKELLPPASRWADKDRSGRILYSEMLDAAVRCPDPFLLHRGDWVGRRLSPSNRRIELESLRKTPEMDEVLRCMGLEAANAHLGGRNRKRLRKAVGAIRKSTLVAAVRRLRKAVARDHEDWKSG
ncbi:MAG TPA: DUF2252 family protein [Candidatus Polarisedimenticolaceae bacterium]|nr:DUF2252 family protein [Candidatus Polarisedimenticolaceae bacterium]